MSIAGYIYLQVGLVNSISVGKDLLSHLSDLFATL